MKLPHPFTPIAGNPVTAITPPGKGKVRTRQVVNRSNARATGKFYSWKAQRMIQWESVHELHAFRLLDADPTVVSFGEQPMTIDYDIGGTHTYHVPDILVRTQAGWEVWEIKPQANAAAPDVLARTRLLAQALPPHGYEYRMVIGEDLAREPRMSSITTILRFGSDAIPPTKRESARRFLETTASISWGDIKNGVHAQLDIHCACRFLLEGLLCWDSEQPLLSTAVLTTPPLNVVAPSTAGV